MEFNVLNPSQGPGLVGGIIYQPLSVQATDTGGGSFEKNRRSIAGYSDHGWFVLGRGRRANLALERAEGKFLVRRTAVAGGQQLHAQVGDQPTGDVAGSDLQSGRDR